MLDLESRLEILGITCYRDADDAARYYYLPGNPRISRDAGGPMFDLFTYTKGGEAGQTRTGGFLTMTVDCGLGDLQDRVKAALTARAGIEVNLSSVPFSGGTVRLLALDETAASAPGLAAGPRFVEQVLGAGTPSLDGDNRAIFSLTLSEDGAAFFLGVLQGQANARPLGVVYDLTYVGLLPAYSVDVSIDISSSYDFTHTRFAAGCVFFSADIESISEELKQNNHITITEKVRVLELSTPEAIADRTKKLNDLVATLCSGVLFQPTLVPGAPKAAGNALPLAGGSRPGGTTQTPTGGTTNPTGGTSGGTSGGTTNPTGGTSGGTSGSARSDPPPPDEDEVPSTGTTTSGGGASGGTGGVSGGSGASGSGGSGASGSGTGTGGTRGTGTTGSGTSGSGTPGSGGSGSGTTGSGGGGTVSGGSGTGGPSGGSGSGNTSGQPGGNPSAPGSGAQKLYEELGRPQLAFTLRTISQEERKTITYSLDQVTAQARHATPQGQLLMLCSAAELAQRIHPIDLNNPLFQRLKITIECPDVDFAAEGVAQMTVEIRYGVRPDGTGPKDTGAALLRQTSDRVDLEFFVDHTRNLEYEYRLVVDYRADFGVGSRQTHVEGPWTPTELRTLAVHPRWLQLMVPARVVLAPNVPTDVTEVQVSVRYRRPDLGIDDGHLLVLSPGHRAELVPLRLASPGDQVTFTPVVFYSDGASETLPAQVLPSALAKDALSLGVPRAGRLEGDIILVDALGEVSRSVVDLQVSQHDALVDNRSLEITGAASRVLWSVRLPDRDAPASLRWRQRVSFADGGLEEGEWGPGTSTNLVAGVPAEGVLTVVVRYVGAPPSAFGLAGLVVELAYADPGGDATFAQTEALFFDDASVGQPQEWRVRLADRAARTYTWSLTSLRADGTQSSTTPQPAVQDRLFVRPPAGAPAGPAPTPTPTPPPPPGP